MAPTRLSMLVVIATMFLPSIVMATEYVVGDDHGWTLGFDYNAWAANKVFQVGDTLGKLISSNMIIWLKTWINFLFTIIIKKCFTFAITI